MKLEVLRDRNGRLLGTILQEYGGKRVLRDNEGTKLGEYDPRDTVTRDRYGYRVGTGNLLVMFLPSVASKAASGFYAVLQRVGRDR